MARLNIEESLWSDPRFQNFMIRITDRHKAIGMAVDLWRVAQKYWWPEKQLIPEDVWVTLGLPETIIECGLAERRPDGVYARGAEEHFKWWFDRQAAGRRGGVASAKSRMNRITEAGSSNTEPELSKTKQIEPSSSFSASSSNSKKRRLTVRESDLEPIYQIYPKRPNQRKSIGMRTLIGQIKTDEDFFQLKEAVQNYSRYVAEKVDDPKYIQRFASFTQVWREWTNASLGAENSSTKVVRNSEDV